MRAASEAKSRTSIIDPRVAESSRLPEATDKAFTIGYSNYRDDLCQIKSMKVSYIRKVFEHHKAIGKCTSEPEIFELPFDIKSVGLNGHYKKYASKLTPDIELNEFDAGEYRGFFYIDRTNKVLEMVALDYHPEDGKNKK